LDEGCGQIIDHLKKKKLYENTIFIYTCDNGWVQDPEKKNRSIRSKRRPVEAGIRTPMFITQEGSIDPLRDAQTLASNIDIAPTILKACGIEPPAQMTGLDLQKPDELAKRNRVFVDVYQHDSDLDQLDNLRSGLIARVVIDGWDKLIAGAKTKQLFDLKEKVMELSKLIDNWVGGK
jgi:uncharacterized sulfatase